MEVDLDVNLFQSRVIRLRELWNEKFHETGSVWKGLRALIFLRGRQNETIQTPKTDKFHLWISGYVFPETLVVVIYKGPIYIVTGPKKLALLKALVQYEKIVLLEKSNTDENRSSIERIVNDISNLGQDSSMYSSQLNLGFLLDPQEKAEGTFAEQVKSQFSKLLVPKKFRFISMDEEIALMLSILDKQGLMFSRKAALFGVRLAQETLITKIEDILDNETKETHLDIVNAVESSLDDPKIQQRWKTSYKLEPDDLDLVFVNVQSGPSCNIDHLAVASNEPLYTDPGTIFLSLGVKYQDYTAAIARTLLFNATKEQRSVYQFVYDTLEYGITLLKPDVPFKEVYKSLMERIEQQQSFLLPYVSHDFGHAMGLEYKDSSLVINADSKAILCQGMVVALSISFTNIECKSTGSPYTCGLMDTVEICAVGENPRVLTQVLEKRLKMVNYELSDEPPVGEGNEQEEKKEKDKSSKEDHMTAENNKTKKKSQEGHRHGEKEADVSLPVGEGSIVLRSRLRSCGESLNYEEMENIRRHQKMLRVNKLKELQQRFKGGDAQGGSTDEKPLKKLSMITAYTDASDYPKELKPHRIFLDTAAECLLLPIPILGHVPFHISMIRNVLCQTEDKKFSVLRIQFKIPGMTGSSNKSEGYSFPDALLPDTLFIKELVFRSSQGGLSQLCKSLKDLQRNMRQEQLSNTSQAPAATQPLITTHRDTRRILLKNVLVKAGTSSRRAPGILEAYSNGLRYSGNRVETIEVNYSNIRHAFFQPCENDFVVLIHLHLKSPIIVNKRKTVDIQFLTEIGTQMEDLDQHRRQNLYDPDEVLLEQREREMKYRINCEFKKFSQAVQDIARAQGCELEFEIPYRELGFYGVPKNSNQFIMPTARCLVQLLEWPVFILILREVEIVSFERVYHGLRQFDMVFVFKDYHRPVRQITTIPTTSLCTIKRWLNEVDLVWYESKGNLNWTEILKTICEDIPGFIEDGAFGIFLGDDLSSPRKRSKKTSNRSKDNTDGPEDTQEEEDDESDDESDDDDDDDADSTLHITDSEDEEDDDEEDDESVSSGETSDESLSLASENDSSASHHSTEESEKGLTWEELEHQAIQEDRKRLRAATEGGLDKSRSDAVSQRKRKKPSSPKLPGVTRTRRTRKSKKSVSSRRFIKNSYI